ncbi:MAG: hypothetical protein R6U91_07090 [Bacillota bacterium]
MEDVVDHQVSRPSINAVTKSDELANNPRHADLLAAESNITRNM